MEKDMQEPKCPTCGRNETDKPAECKACPPENFDFEKALQDAIKYGLVKGGKRR